MIDEIDILMAALEALPVVDIGRVVQREQQVSTAVQEPVAVPTPVSIAPSEETMWGEAKITAESMLKMAHEIFGEARVQQTIYDDSILLYIHFPEIVLSNSIEERHTIKDMYVRIGLSSVGLSSGDVTFTGLRSTLTTAEYNSGYCHSHLPTSCTSGVFANFCTGSSFFTSIILNCKSTQSEECWYLMLVSLERYLEWESLEGGPHVRIRDIKSGNNRSSYNLESYMVGMIDHMPEGPVYVIGSTVMVDDCHPALLPFYSEYSPIRNTVGPSAENSSVTQNIWDSRNLQRSRNGLLTFKENKVMMKIISTESVISEVDNTISPDVVGGYNVLLKQKATHFNNIFNREYAKYNYGTQFGEGRAVEQADVNRYKAAARAHRMATQGSRKARVVGGVDNIRKREDNRFG